MIRFLKIFGIAFREKSSFPKNVNVRKQYESSSRIDVRGGSPKKKEIEQRGISVKNLLKKGLEKGTYIRRKNLQKVIKKGGKNGEKTFKKFARGPQAPAERVDIRRGCALILDAPYLALYPFAIFLFFCWRIPSWIPPYPPYPSIFLHFHRLFFLTFIFFDLFFDLFFGSIFGRFFGRFLGRFGGQFWTYFP